VTLLVLGFLPFVLVAFAQSPRSEWAFMGVLHEHVESSTALARMKQGENGQWLTHLLFTPEPHLSALVQPLYPLLGQLSRFSFNSLSVVFHVTRLLATATMFLAVYQLGATIWLRIRSRRVFFVVASAGSGLGWLVSVLTGEALTLDFTSPHAFPFYASLVNVHYPLALTFVALLVAVMITVLRPRYEQGQDPNVQNGGAVVVFAVVALMFLYPEAMLPLGGAFVLCLAVAWWQARRLNASDLRWISWLLIPALPIGTYYALTLFSNPFIAQWVRQQDTPTISLPFFLLGLGLPLVVALPAIGRALKRFEADGDRFMLLWLGLMLLGYVLPVSIHEHFIFGLMLPVAYFVTRALDEFWFHYISRRYRSVVFVVGVPSFALSLLFALFIPILPLLFQRPQDNLVLETDYLAAFQWLDTVANDTDVVLASPDVSLWIPSQLGARVVYGHPKETMFPAAKRAVVNQWYSATETATCQQLRGVQRAALGYYWVDFAILGPRERALGEGKCVQGLTQIATFGRVAVYYCDLRCKLVRLNELP
jgi:hypothetical protein